MALAVGTASRRSPVVRPPAGPGLRLRAAAERAWARLWAHPAREAAVPLAALSAVSAVGTASAPALLQWPLLLVLLSPRLVFLSLAATQVHWALFLLVGVLRLCVADPFHYRLGEVCGDRALARLPGPLRRWTERSTTVQRPLAALIVLLRPNGLYLAWAGSLGLHPRLVAGLALTGTVGYLLALRAGAVALVG